MITTSLSQVFQLLTALLLVVHNNPQLPSSTVQQIASIESQAVQLNAQVVAMPKIPFPIPKNDSIWPNITDLRNAAYLDAEGNYVPDGTGVALVEEDTSFGDMNADGFDDAAVVIQTTDSSGNTSFALAAMLNQGGMMFNVADLPLGKKVQVFSHHVVQGGTVVMDMQIDDQPSSTYTYQLVGTQLMKI